MKTANAPIWERKVKQVPSICSGQALRSTFGYAQDDKYWLLRFDIEHVDAVGGHRVLEAGGGVVDGA